MRPGSANLASALSSMPRSSSPKAPASLSANAGPNISPSFPLLLSYRSKSTNSFTDLRSANSPCSSSTLPWSPISSSNSAAPASAHMADSVTPPPASVIPGIAGVLSLLLWPAFYSPCESSSSSVRIGREDHRPDDHSRGHRRNSFSPHSEYSLRAASHTAGLPARGRQFPNCRSSPAPDTTPTHSPTDPETAP